jgi:hypothetical protein
VFECQCRTDWEGPGHWTLCSTRLQAGRRVASAQLEVVPRVILDVPPAAQGRSAFYSADSDEHCVTSYDLVDWMDRGSAAHVSAAFLLKRKQELMPAEPHLAALAFVRAFIFVFERA